MMKSLSKFTLTQGALAQLGALPRTGDLANSWQWETDGPSSDNFTSKLKFYAATTGDTDYFSRYHELTLTATEAGGTPFSNT